MKLPHHHLLRLSLWVLMGAALILGLVVLTIAARNTQKERERMAQHLTDRAAALIWALEGSRTRMAAPKKQLDEDIKRLVESAEALGTLK